MAITGLTWPSTSRAAMPRCAAPGRLSHTTSGTHVIQNQSLCIHQMSLISAQQSTDSTPLANLMHVKVHV